MDRVFSLEEISDQFWPPPQNPPPPSAPGESKMNRSPSEWAFEKFLQEAASSLSDTSSKSPPAENDVVEVEDPTPLQNQNFHSHGQQQPNGIQPAPTASFDIPVDSEDYQAFLKSRLNLACAAVALTRAPFVMAQTSAAPSDCASQASANSQSGSRPPSKGSQDKDVREFPALPTNTVQKNIVPLSKSTGSGSSRDLSDDDEAEGEDETTENMDPSDAKRVRRMLSNRESARRSRRRKQAHLTELETQVAQLRLENSSLVKRLTDISQKYSEATVDNRVLKANVETLRAKVKMADESVKRVTGMNPLIQAMSEISMMSFPPPPFNDSSPSNAAAAASDAAAVPVHNDHPPKAKQQQHLYQPAPSNPILTPQADNDGTTADSGAVVGNVLQTPVNSAVPVGGNKTSSSSLQRVASLEHLQKRIIHGHGGTNQYGTSQCNGGEL